MSTSQFTVYQLKKKPGLRNLATRVFPQSLKSKVSKNFEPLNQHQMELFLSVLTKYRNVCAHGERLFTYRTVSRRALKSSCCIVCNSVKRPW